MNILDKKLFNKCVICEKTKKEIGKLYGGKNIHYPKSFEKHIKNEHGISLTEYVNKHLNIISPICPCGICNKHLDIRHKQSNFQWKMYACWRSPEKLKNAENIKLRKGILHPNYGKPGYFKGFTKETHPSLMASSLKQKGKIVSEETRKKISKKNKGKMPWSKGLTKETDIRLKSLSEKNKNKIITDETKKKMSDAKKGKPSPQKGKKISEYRKMKCREHTLKMIKEGKFKHNETLPVKLFKELLIKLNIEFEQEKILAFWSFDFYLPKYNIYVEIDGDYWHSNPKFYPNGPISKTQIKNSSRHKAKTSFCQNKNINLIRFWENDIKNNIKDVEEILLCRLSELFQLEKSA